MLTLAGGKREVKQKVGVIYSHLIRTAVVLLKPVLNLGLKLVTVAKNTQIFGLGAVLERNVEQD